MREVFVEELVESGNTLHPAVDVGDFMNAQAFSHQHVTAIVRDLLSRGADSPLVVGFDYTLGGGFVVNVHAPGHVVKVAGESFQLFGSDPTSLTIAGPDGTNPRIDLIYALLTADDQQEDEYRSFRQAGQNSSVQRNVPTQLWNNATVLVRTGTPGSAPLPPALNANEVPLYQITISPTLTSLASINITDVRNTPRSLLQLGSDVKQIAALLKGAKPTYTAAEIGLGTGAGAYAGKSVEQFVDDYMAAGAGLQYPEILTPELTPIDVNAGTLGSVGTTDSGSPVVDIPAGRQIVFSNGPRTLVPAKFPSANNARIVSKAAGAGSETSANAVSFSLATAILDDTDAPQNFALKSAVLPSPRFAPAMAGRGSHFIEIFGGTTGSGGLSDWNTYDTLADTITPRTITGDVPPASANAQMFSCGINSDYVLLYISENSGWYKVNAATGASVKLTTGVPSGTPNANDYVRGDLIQSDLIFFVLSRFAGATTYWSFRPSTNTFAQLTVSGSTPPAGFRGCMYRDSQFVAVNVDGSAPNPEAGGTWIFDYPTLTWTKVASGSFPDLQGTTFQFGQCGLAYVDGRVLLVGAEYGVSPWLSPTPHEWAFELAPTTNPAWKRLSNPNITPRRSFGMAALRDTQLTGSLALTAGGYTGQAYDIGDTKIYKSVGGGLIETTFSGGTALTLSPDATYAIFHVASLTLPWQVDNLIASLVGSFPAGSIKLEYSLDDGATYQTVTPGMSTAVGVSATPGVRRLRITLFNAGSAPILKTINELFHEHGGSSFGTTNLVLRYTVTDTANPHWLFIDNAGNVTLESAAAQTTPTKAVLVKVTPAGSSAPTVKDYLNQRRVHRKYTGTKSGGVDPTFTSRFSRPASFIQAFRIPTGGTALADLADPTHTFDTAVTVTGLNNGDSFRVEMEA